MKKGKSVFLFGKPFITISNELKSCFAIFRIVVQKDSSLTIGEMF